MDIIDTIMNIAVKIECSEGEKKREGTGTIISNGDHYYVMTAGHCIKKDDNTVFKKESICITTGTKIKVNVMSIIDFDLSEAKDFALLSVEKPNTGLWIDTFRVYNNMMEVIYEINKSSLSKNNLKMNNGNKLLIANIGSSNTGKSSAIKEFYSFCTTHGHTVKTIYNGGDVCAIIEVEGVKIGIESQGDPNSRMYETLELLDGEDCDVIVCACRSYGGTREEVEDLRDRSGYTLVWMPNPRSEETEIQEDLNKIYAMQVWQTIKSLLSK